MPSVFDQELVVMRSHKLSRLIFTAMTVGLYVYVFQSFGISLRVADLRMLGIIIFILTVLFLMPAVFVFSEIVFDHHHFESRWLGILFRKHDFSEIKCVYIRHNSLCLDTENILTFKIEGAFENYKSSVKELLSRIKLVNPQIQISDEVKKKFNIP